MRPRDTTERRPIPRTDQEGPLTGLGNAELRGVQHQQRRSILRSADPVDGLQGRLNQTQALIFSLEGQPRYVLHQEGARPGVAQNPQKGGHRIRSRVIKTARISGRPVTSLRERLTGRPPDQDIDLAWTQVGDLQQVCAGDLVNGSVYHGPRPVGPEGSDTVLVDLDRCTALESGRLKPEV